MFPIFIKIFRCKAEIDHPDKAILNAEIVRLDISVDIFWNLMQALDRIKHSKHCIFITIRLSFIIDSFVNTLIYKLHLYNIGVIEKCFAKKFRGIFFFISMKNIRNFLKNSRFKNNLFTRETVVFKRGFCCKSLRNLIFSFIKIDYTLSTFA